MPMTKRRGGIVLTIGESRIIDDSNLSSAEGGGDPSSVLGPRSSRGPLTLGSAGLIREALAGVDKDADRFRQQTY